MENIYRNWKSIELLANIVICNSNLWVKSKKTEKQHTISIAIAFAWKKSSSDKKLFFFIFLIWKSLKINVINEIWEIMRNELLLFVFRAITNVYTESRQQVLNGGNTTSFCAQYHSLHMKCLYTHFTLYRRPHSCADEIFTVRPLHRTDTFGLVSFMIHGNNK